MHKDINVGNGLGEASNKSGREIREVRSNINEHIPDTHTYTHEIV